MQRLEVSGAVGLIYKSLGVKGLSISKMRERMETTKCQTETHETKRLREFLSKHRREIMIKRMCHK